MDSSITWAGTMTARSSIAHGGETRGTISFLRRELVVAEDGSRVLVPLISGNALRGRLRRTGEELLRDVLEYEGLIPAPAAHALRGGGSLAKTGREPLSGARLGRLRALVPQLGVFGAAGGGTIMDGALEVGKLYPVVAETVRITGVPAAVTAFEATQLETYARVDDGSAHDFAAVITQPTFDADGTPVAGEPGTGSAQMQFSVETFPAGTQFTVRMRLRRPTPLEAAFFVDVLGRYTQAGSIGGRAAIGHGQISLALTADPDPVVEVDWRQHCRDHRDAILSALHDLR